VHTLRVWNQAKQAAQSGPPLALTFLRSQTFSYTGPKQQNNQRTPDRLYVPSADPPRPGGLWRSAHAAATAAVAARSVRVTHP
jgi:hypothetical protein